VNNVDYLIEQLHEMRHNDTKNYIAPGLTSSLIGGHPSGERGLVRMFIAERDTREQWVTPHNHRFDFVCLVLQGKVTQFMYYRDEQQIWPGMKAGPRQPYAVTKLFGTHDAGYGLEDPMTGPVFYRIVETLYGEGDTYRMKHDEFHSIRFSEDAMVLFFEGPKLDNPVFILEPWVDGERVPTFKTEPWMFKR
jgi:hypothetical protein